MEKVLVLGASLHTNRYSNMAVKKLLANGFKVIGLGSTRGQIDAAEVWTAPQDIEGLYAVSIYLNPHNQSSYFNYIVALAPEKVVFNPGAENSVLEALLDQHGIAHERACTLVLLSLGKF